jgi:hypothetical protein
MKTVNLSQLSNLDVLREYAPRMLVAMMDDHRAFIASKGVELPPVGREDELDIEALASVFTSVGDFPKELVDRFHMVRQMSGPRQMDRILATVQAQKVQFPLPLADCSPEDIAAQLLLTNPRLFQELHAEVAVTRYRAFAYFVPHRKRLNFKPPTNLAALERSLNSWYETHQRGRTAKVFWRQHGEEFWFHVRHAEPLKREGLVQLQDGASGSAIYHPERHGLVVYNERLGEARMHADSEQELDVFRVVFGLHLFQDGSYFPVGSHKFSLEVLKRGRGALVWSGIPHIRSITLTVVEFQVGGDVTAREKISAPDVYTVFEAREFQIPPAAEIVAARFRVFFEGEKVPRHFTIRPSNHATFARDQDAVMLEPWLVRQQVAVRPADYCGVQSAVANFSDVMAGTLWAHVPVAAPPANCDGQATMAL